MGHLVLVLFILLSSIGIGQGVLDQSISIKFNHQEIEKCLIQLEKESGIRFSYNSKQIRTYKTAKNLKFEATPLNQILDALFLNTPLNYKAIGDQITVYELTTTSESIVISGYIRAKNSGEEIVGARIYFPDYGVGCITNSYGYYAIELPKGLATYRVSSLGMLSLNQSAVFSEPVVLNFELQEDTLLLQAVLVETDSLKHRNEDLVDLSRIDQTIITPLAISRVPAASGERDLLRHLQQLPGVQPSNDGGANFQVRGSGTGSNMVLIDEIPIYHPTHLLGLYSIINTDALKSASFYKDYIPLQYGTRSASVLQIITKEGDLNKHHISGGISGFMGRLNLEGPIVKKQASFYFSGRFSTFPEALLSILGNQQLGNPSFYDLNGKVNIKINSNNRIYLTGYFGRDELTDSTSNYKWGNVATGFRWNHIINSKTFSNLSITHSEFSYGFSNYNGITDANYGQKVVTDKVNYDVTHFYSNSLKVNCGISASYLRTNNGNFGGNANLFLQRQAWENGIYAAIEKTFSPRLSIKGGIRIPYSFHIGTGDTTSYLNSDLSLSQVIYQKNKFYDPVFFIDPRIVGSYALDEHHELQFAAMVTSQNTHIINYVNYFLPIEIWTPSTSYLKPERNYQVSFGLIRTIRNTQFSAILYGKQVRNILDYASPIFTASTDIESNLLAGKLNVFGAEFMLNYQFTTWYSASISYAYTKTQQQINGINNNEPYVATNDRPHYLSFSQFFNLSKEWQLTTNIIAHSGTAITLPNGQFIIDGTAFPLYSSPRNAERLPNFRRVDLSFRRQLGVQKQKNNWDLTYTITNFFNRSNPSVAFVQQDQYDPSKLVIRGIDYSPFMISLSLNFHF